MIIGHQNQISYLNKLIEKGNAEGAFIFVGPEKVGKRKVAEIFAKAASCIEHGILDTLSCKKCNPEDFLHPDIASFASTNIPIDNIRSIGSFLNTSPIYGARKVAIIDGCHNMSHEAANSFLKTLEEPKGHSLTIMITHSVSALLPTIVSRARVIRFGRVSKQHIEPFLATANIKQNLKNQILDFYRGLPGEVFEWANDPSQLLKVQKEIEEFIRISQSDFHKVSSFCESISKKENPFSTIYNWICWLENTLAESLLLGRIDQRTLNAINLLENFEKKIKDKSVDLQLFLENLFLTLSADS